MDNLSEPTNLEQYLDDGINAYTAEDSGYRDVEILERDTTISILAGKVAYRLLFTGDVEINTHKFLEVGTINEGRPIFIKYEAEECLFEQYLPLAQRMIDSFEITN